MTMYREVNTGQVVDVEDARLAWFKAQARWQPTDEKPAPKTTTRSTATATAGDEKPKTTRRRTTKPKTTTED